MTASAWLDADIDADIDVDIDAAGEVGSTDEVGLLSTEDTAELAEEAFAEVLEEDPQAATVLNATAPSDSPTAHRLTRD